MALATGTGTLRKVASLSSLKTGVNGPIKFAVDVTAPPNTNSIYLVKTGARAVTALEGTCRHHGCLINWVAADTKFECPCHGSQYAMTGAVVHGPATKNLFKHKVVIRAGQVWVLSIRATA
jgi:Rieske Fe-S protein